MLVVTPEAIKYIASQMRLFGKPTGILIDIKTSGCNGNSYLLDWAPPSLSPDFLLIDDSDAKLYVTPEARKILANASMIVQKNGLGWKFDFVNPIETSRCGCGQTFSIK